LPIKLGWFAVNAALNYGYGFLEGECRRAINAVGLEPSVGFLHDLSDYQTKQSLVYDLEEPFRWLIDVTVMQAFESGSLDVPHFYFTGDDYRYRFDPEARSRFIGLLREQFNSGVSYDGQVMKWGTVIERKVTELSRFLTGKSPVINFAGVFPKLPKIGERALRDMTLEMSYSDAKQHGIGKSTLQYLQLRAKQRRPLDAYAKTLQRIS
jgi:CRISPR-associated protein Cas1